MQSITAPTVGAGELLIANQASLVSAGTEKMVMDLAKKSLLGKARERPDHVRRVLEKIKNEGLINTINQVRKKLDEPMTMGYSSAGVVVACGEGVQEYKPGDRVASNGPHAEVVSVPRNLCAAVPDNVPFEHAAFTVLGSIALQGLRLAKCEFGETAFVIGLGLVGQLTVALLRAGGMRVIGTDLDAARCELAMQMGADFAEPGLSASDIETRTRGLGADAVIITASTKSNDPIELAAGAVRKKGRVVLVGVVGLELDRRPWFFKEAEFVVSCSYGPGRYDPEYEDRGHDYPAPYVRWTEQRNMQAVLDMMGGGRLDVSPLVSHRFEIADAEKAYQLIEKGDEPYLGIVMQYPEIAGRTLYPKSTSASSSAATSESGRSSNPTTAKVSGKIRCGVLGAGNFARMVLLPAIQKCGRFDVATICSAKGVSANHAAQTMGIPDTCTDEDAIFADPTINTVFSITRHDHHARHVLKAIEAGKNIFVEKPLCLTSDELNEIHTAVQSAGSNCPRVMVGFNRRFSPAAVQLREFFDDVKTPLTMSFRFNAGPIPADHWTQNTEEGGGRIIGEACHGIDFACALMGPPVRVYADSVRGEGNSITDDQTFITLRHESGGVSNIAYVSSGDKSFPKERIEVLGGGRLAILDDFKKLTFCKSGRTQELKLAGQDKGHNAEVTAFSRAIGTGEGCPIPWPEIWSVSAASILAVRSLREGIAFDF